jgi:hypothetical protein
VAGLRAGRGAGALRTVRCDAPGCCLCAAPPSSAAGWDAAVRVPVAYCAIGLKQGHMRGAAWPHAAPCCVSWATQGLRSTMLRVPCCGVPRCAVPRCGVPCCVLQWARGICSNGFRPPCGHTLNRQRGQITEAALPGCTVTLATLPVSSFPLDL